jgi:hypothetical protein
VYGTQLHKWWDCMCAHLFLKFEEKPWLQFCKQNIVKFSWILPPWWHCCSWYKMQMTKAFYIYGSQVDLLQQTIFFVFNTQNSELNFQLCEFSVICFIRDGIVFYLVFSPKTWSFLITWTWLCMSQAIVQTLCIHISRNWRRPSTHMDITIQKILRIYGKDLMKPRQT